MLTDKEKLDTIEKMVSYDYDLRESYKASIMKACAFTELGCMSLLIERVLKDKPVVLIHRREQ